MTSPRRVALLSALTAVSMLALALPAGALAHGDPASHYLEVDQLYPGFANRPSQAVELQLLGLLEAARKDGYPIKVGIVGSPDDLTEDPSMFTRPQAYAEYVSSLLGAPNVKAPILIVSPNGLGIAGVRRQDSHTLPVTRAAAKRLGAPISVSRRADGDELARAAMQAVRRIARAGGHALPADVPPAKVLSPTPRHGSSSGIGGLLPFIVFAAVFLSAWVYFETRTRLARRRARARSGIPPAALTDGPHARRRPD